MYKALIKTALLMGALTIVFFFVRIFLELGWGLLWDGVRLRGIGGHLSVLLEWLPILTTYVICGIVIQYIVDRTKRFYWIGIVGGASTVLILLTSEIYFAQRTGLFVRGVLYLYYLMPIVGIVLGSLLSEKWRKV